MSVSTRVFQVATTLALVVSCVETPTTSDPPAPGLGNQPAVDEGAPQRVPPSPLPAAGGFPALSYAAGDSPPPRPDLCGWVDAADVIVWGELVDLRLNLLPAARATHNPPDYFEWMDSGCADSTSWDPSIEFTIKVDFAIKGEPPTTIVALGPPFRASSLRPQPVLSEDGSILWQGEPEVGEPFVLGQKIGIAAYYIPEYGVYSVLFEPFFGQDEWGNITFAPEGEFEAWNFPRPPLEGVVGQPPSQVAEDAAQCNGGSPDGVARREEAFYLPEGATRSPWVFAASCSPTLDYYQQQP